MFGRKSKTAAPVIPPHPDDNLHLKSTGERVTILRRYPDGGVHVALVDKPYPAEDIVSADDIRPA
ncbi:hypothetical protein ACIRP0_13145 [Streptomyces sp. NPDC101733]|uniref:hypothetical protein n=1 Tax=unclassified Streptomyces TaxID=2593676 RepID=UPI0037FFED9C